MPRQWFAGGSQWHEDGTRDWYAGGSQLVEDQGSLDPESGAASLDLAFGLDVAAVAVAQGSADLAIGFGASASGRAVAVASADLALAFDLDAGPTPVAAASADLTLALGLDVTPAPVAIGSADVALTIGLDAAPAPVALGAADVAITLGIDVAGEAVEASTGLAASFTAANSEYLSKSGSSVDTGGKSYAIAFWAYVNALGSQEFFVSKYQGLTTGEFYVGKDTSNRLIWRLVGNSSFYDLVTTGTTFNQGWNFVAVSYDNATKVMSASLNGGSFVNRAAFSDSPKSNATPSLILGAQMASTGFLTGRLQALGIWTGRTLSSGDVADLHNSGDGVLYAQLPPGLLTGLVPFYDLGEESDGSGPVTRLDSHGTDHLTDNNTVPSAEGIVSGEDVAEGAASLDIALGLSASAVAVAEGAAGLALAFGAAASARAVAVASAEVALTLAIDVAAESIEEGTASASLAIAFGADVEASAVPIASASLGIAAGIGADAHAVAIGAADLALAFGADASAAAVALAEADLAITFAIDVSAQVGSVAVGPTHFASTAELIGPDPRRATAALTGPDPTRSTAAPA